MITGLDEARKNLEKLAAIGDRISFTDMFTPQFISKHSNFETVEDFFQKSGFKIESQSDFEAIPDDEWETFITQNTSFGSWEDMQKSAFNSVIEEALAG